MQALPLAEAGTVVAFGVNPTSAEIGYGYIRCGEKINDDGAAQLTAFVEKPDHDTALQYLADGDYLWNSGIYLLRASVWLNQIERFRPDILLACEAAISAGSTDQNFIRVDRSAFMDCPSESIDYAVMEPLALTDRDHKFCAVQPLSVGWSDVGAWNALMEIGEKDQNGNLLSGDVLAMATNNTLVRSESRLVACIGLQDIVVVETADVVMVAHRDQLHLVKDAVSELKTAGRTECDMHRKVQRPWGYYDGIDEGHRFQVKRIVVSPGACLSLQMHHHRAEHWVVVKGTARVTRGDEQFLLSENQSTYIPLGVTHRLENPGLVPLEIIEIQSGAYLGEDDIVRFEDNYSRDALPIIKPAPAIKQHVEALASAEL
jgi:mannose-1-phosphate guanylyltransferase/mannose-6-phosphate isomerase